MMRSTYENSGLLGPVSSSHCFEGTYWLGLYPLVRKKGFMKYKYIIFYTFTCAAEQRPRTAPIFKYLRRQDYIRIESVQPSLPNVL
jgi:hypothetical protein